jgi:ATP-binding cassette subfamily B (MDR/TAP) protein 7
MSSSQSVFLGLYTSALDAHTEFELMRNISNTLLDKVRTSIFIAHWLRTVVEAGEYPCLPPQAPRVSVGVFLLESTPTSLPTPTLFPFTDPSAAYLLNLLDLIIVLKSRRTRDTQEKGLYCSMWLQQASLEGAGNGVLE